MVEPKTNVMKLTIVKKVKSMKILLLSSVKRIARGMRTFFFFFILRRCSSRRDI